MAQAVRGLEGHWAQRHPVLPTFTLGAAAYLDVPASGLASYRIRAARTNPVLRTHFGAALDELVDALADVLGGPTRWAPRRALPGFHVFLFHPQLTAVAPSLHFDLQHHLLAWPEAVAASDADRCSFTVLIESGRRGAGLRTWPLTHAEHDGLDEAELLQRVRDRPPTAHRYELGELFVHPGSLLHQIDPTPGLDEGEARTTLQGHAVRLDGEWCVYW